MSDHTHTRLKSGAIWRDFCARLADAGDIILAEDISSDPLDRAEGFRYLSRLTRVGLEMCLESADPNFPYFYRASHETAKIGADNPDNVYWTATVSGTNTYRIRGRRGTMTYFSIGSKANRYHEDGTMASTGELEDAAIAWGPDDTVEFIASAKPQPGNWLRMASDTSFILIRQSYLDRAREKPGHFEIECIDGPDRPALLTAELLDAALIRTGQFVNGTAQTFANWTRKFREQPNELPWRAQSTYWQAGGDPKIVYYHGYFDIKPDEAWVIDFTPPDCPYWNFQLNNWWMESLDYRFAPVTVNKHTAQYNPDGSVTLVISARNPGAHNWLDTTGHRHGTALLRWVGATENPRPSTRICKLDKFTHHAGL